MPSDLQLVIRASRLNGLGRFFDSGEQAMTAQEFAYWLQGYSEIAGDAPNAEQWQIIQDHLKLVFEKRTPNYTVPSFPQSPPPVYGDRVIC